MARKSRARRIAAKQGLALSLIKRAKSKQHAAEHACLQQGSPRVSTGSKLSRWIGKAAIPARFTSPDKQPQPTDFRDKPKRVTPGTKRQDRREAERLTAEFLAKGGKIT